MAVVIDVVTPTESSNEVQGGATVVEVVRGGSSPIETVMSQATVETVRKGGTVANAQWGYGFPEFPYEGQIWISVSE